MIPNLIKNIWRAVVPEGARNAVNRKRLYFYRTRMFFLNTIYDSLNYRRYASPFRVPKSQAALLEYIIMEYHVVEKGLALPSVRPGFGQEVIRRLVEAAVSYEASYGSHAFVDAARQSLKQYAEFNKLHGVSFEYIDRFVGERASQDSEVIGGTLSLRKSEVLSADGFKFGQFARNRYSIRQFTGELVGQTVLLDAVAIAAKSPSVCNRQTSKAYIINSRENITKALSFQNGNRGFGHTAGAVYIVTSDLTGFMSTGERNQAWIDGGLFAMSLAYAVHSLGLGACMLNWSVDYHIDKKLKEAFSIPASEVVIMMMAVGEVPAEFSVAISHRKPLSEFAILIDN